MVSGVGSENLNMDLSGIPTPKFDWESTNLPEQWRKFKSHVELIFDGPLKEKSEEIKVNYLLLWIGDKGREIRETWTDLDGSGSELATARKKLQTYYDRFQAHVQPKLNPIFARYKFNMETQDAGTIEQFITKLRTLVKDCEYTNADEMIRDRIVFGTSSERVREKLINEGDKLTLEKAVQIAQTYEYSQQQLKTMSQQEVHGINKSNFERPGQSYRKQRRTGSENRGDDRKNQDEKRRSKIQRDQSNHDCSRCGRKHSKTDKCPALGKQCNKCNKYNHFASKCLSKKVIYNKVHDVECHNENELESDDDFVIDCIQCNTNSPSNNQAFCTLLVGSKQKSVKFKLDTGSQVNILPKSVYKSLGGRIESLDCPNETLSAYNNNKLESLGCLVVVVVVVVKTLFKSHTLTSSTISWFPRGACELHRKIHNLRWLPRVLALLQAF